MINSCADSSETDPIDEEEVFDLVRHILDPELPSTLEDLKVIELDHIKVNNSTNNIFIRFTPTVPHCSLTTLIGLCIRVQLLRNLPKRFKVDIIISPGKHDQEKAINRQLNDKERVSAACENSSLMSVVEKCIANAD